MVDNRIMSPLYDQVYVLNLDKDTERMATMRKRLARLGIDFERWPAKLADATITSNNPEIQPGHFASLLSHRAIFVNAQERKFKRILVLEDDVLLRDDTIPMLTKMFNQIEGIPWDVFFLGLHLFKEEAKVSENVGKVIESFHVHAYMVNESAYERIIRWADHVYETRDICWDGLHPTLIRFFADPILAVQEPNVSYTTGAYMDRLPQYFERFSGKEFALNCADMREADY